MKIYGEEIYMKYEENVYDRLREIVTNFVHFLFTMCLVSFENDTNGTVYSIEKTKRYLRYLQQIMSLNLFTSNIKNCILPTLELIISSTFNNPTFKLYTPP